MLNIQNGKNKSVKSVPDALMFVEGCGAGMKMFLFSVNFLSLCQKLPEQSVLDFD